MWKSPKYIASHPGVERVMSGEGTGSDYRHYVETKPNWHFTNGRQKECGSGFFNNREDFEYAALAPCNS